MSTRSLEEDLLEIPGVEGAEVEGDPRSPAGLRIRIAEGADQALVGASIRRILTKHGLGTDTRLPGEVVDASAAEDAAAPADLDQQPVQATEEVAVATELEASSVAVLAAEDEASDEARDTTDAEVIDLTAAEAQPDESSEGDRTAMDDVAPEGTASAIIAELPQDAEISEDVGAEDSEEAESGAETEAGAPVGSSIASASSDGIVPRIDRVAVEEARDGITVLVSSADGRTERAPASATEGGVETAVVTAAARLARPGTPDPTIVEIEDRRIEGVDIVMIVLEVNGSMAVGAAVVGAGRSFALGRATWAALSL